MISDCLEGAVPHQRRRAESPIFRGWMEAEVKVVAFMRNRLDSAAALSLLQLDHGEPSPRPAWLKSSRCHFLPPPGLR